MQTRPVWAEISRSRLLANWNLLRDAAPLDADVMAVVKANAFTKMKYPALPLEFPRLGQDSSVAHRPISHLHQGLENVLPHPINETAAMIVRIECVRDA